MLGGMKKTLMKQAMKLMQSDAGMKLMQDQRVMNVVMQAFALRGKVQGSVEALSERLAKSMGFATREELQKLRALVRDLESTIDRLQSEKPARKASKSEPHPVD